jgi:hypothetical protein
VNRKRVTRRFERGHPATPGFDSVSTAAPVVTGSPVKAGDDAHPEAVILRDVLSQAWLS